MNECNSSVIAYFHEYSDAADADEGGNPRLSLARFLHFLSHTQLFTSCLDHLDAQEIFRDAEATVPGGKTSPGLDNDAFREAVVVVARRLRGDGSSMRAVRNSASGSGVIGDLASSLTHGAGGAKEKREEMQLLQALIRSIHLVRGNAFDPLIAGEIQGPLYVREVLDSIYSYSKALRALYRHYATNSRGESTHDVPMESLARPRHRSISSVSCRSAFRLVRRLNLEPDIIVPAEFAALTRRFVLNLPTDGEKMYFDNRQMIETKQDIDWARPCPSAAGDWPHEPRYDLAGLCEVLAACALNAPPRAFFAPPEVRAQRIHEVFGRRLKLPADDSAQADHFDSTAYLAARLAEKAATASPSTARTTGDLSARGTDTMGALFAHLHGELPMLPPPRGPQVPGPPAGAKLLRRPSTVEEVTQELDALALNPRFLKMSDKGKTNARRRVKANAKVQFPNGQIDYGKVYWLERAPTPRTPASGSSDLVPPRVQEKLLAMGTSLLDGPAAKTAAAAAAATKLQEYRYEQLELLREEIVAHHKAAETLAAPVSGWAMSLALIDEPLLAPRCSLSEEVSTTIETALASRRLRRYGVSVALLIRARQHWATLLAGRTAPAPWRRVQEPMPVPSPWDRRSSTGGALGAMHVAVVEVQHAATPEYSDTSNLPSRARTPAGFGEAPESPVSLGAGGATEAWAAPQDLPGVLPAGRSYDPRRDFQLALGDDADLRLLPAEVGIFFCYELASLHSALREDELAVQLLWKGRKFAESLPSGHPDGAVIWCGLGRLAFHAGNFEIAARTLSRARTIREKSIGGDTMETATTYNNLACCLACLDRALEATAHLELAVEILRSLGSDVHPRTQVAVRNLEKARSEAKHIDMEVPHRFALPMARTQARGRRKAKKKGKAGGSRAGSESSDASARRGRR